MATGLKLVDTRRRPSFSAPIRDASAITDEE